MMKLGSICAYTDRCIHFMMTGCDGKDYPDCEFKERIKAEDKECAVIKTYEKRGTTHGRLQQ